MSIFLLFLLITTSCTLASGQGTRVGFYSKSCPRAEYIVSAAVRSAVQSNPTIAPGILRMHFHDCFVNGCDASLLINGANTEKAALANSLLRGFEVIDDAKKKIEAICPGVVSCADILALAARDSVVLTKGISWSVPTGRRDGLVSLASQASILPGPRDSVTAQKNLFRTKGLNTQDLVTLVGGHTIGTAACVVFSYRLQNFTSNGGPDPSINPTFLAQLRRLCPPGGNVFNRVALDDGSERRFDNSFFNNLRAGKGVLESDQVLWGDASTRGIVQSFLGTKGSARFNAQFRRSMVKMSNIQLKTGKAGEIRRVCTAFNK